MNYEYCNGYTHTIKQGDTLYEISRMHQVPLALLLRANPYVDVFNLQVGDTICIPGKPADNDEAPEPPSEMPPVSRPPSEMPPMNRPDNEMKPPMDFEEVKDRVEDILEDIWEKYVVKPGDTLEDILEDISDITIKEFCDKNGCGHIYLLPGISFYRQKRS